MITDIDMMFHENLRLFVSGGGTMKDGQQRIFFQNILKQKYCAMIESESIILTRRDRKRMNGGFKLMKRIQDEMSL